MGDLQIFAALIRRRSLARQRRTARFRTLLKNWKLARVAVVSLAIALALAVVGMGISNWILLPPPAARDPQQLVALFHRSPQDPVEKISYLDDKEHRDYLLLKTTRRVE